MTQRAWKLAIVFAALAGGPASAHEGLHADDDRSSVHFPVSCSEPAQTEFDRAISLLHHMTYPQAREAFEQVAAIDARCAMAYWGVATTLFQPLWPTRPGLEARQRGWDAVQKAQALQPPTERERLFIDAAGAFFLEPESTDYWLRIRRWEEASERLYAAFPDDPEAATFYALAHLAVVPPDTVSRTNADQAAAILLGVYEKNPDHPGAMHYLVHANDVPGRERELLEVTRKYESAAPNNPHAIEYLVYAYLQKGANAEAAAQLERLRKTERLEPTFKTAFHLASTRARFALARRAWDETVLIAAREPADLDWDRFPWPEGISYFARGLGAAHLGKLEEARESSKRLVELEAAARKSGEELFARNIRLLQLELDAWVAHEAGNQESSVALLHEAADLEASTPKHAVTPAPTLPAQELLGDLLMEQQQPAEALAAYQRSLQLYPNRWNSLRGAEQAQRALGN